MQIVGDIKPCVLHIHLVEGTPTENESTPIELKIEAKNKIDTIGLKLTSRALIFDAYFHVYYSNESDVIKDMMLHIPNNKDTPISIPVYDLVSEDGATKPDGGAVELDIEDSTTILIITYDLFYDCRLIIHTVGIRQATGNTVLNPNKRYYLKYTKVYTDDSSQTHLPILHGIETNN